VRIRRALVPLLLVTTSALAACGGGDGDGDSTASDEPSTSQHTEADAADSADAAACDLLSTDDVTAAVGAPVKEGIATSGPSVAGGTFDTCVWQSDDPANPADTATVTIYPNTAAADSARADDSEDVEGIGDKAFTVAFAGIWVYQGDKSVFVQWYAFSGTDEENLPKSEALARAAVEAL
jgi:hypothetical protein